MALLNLLFPPQCLNCDALVPTHGTLCMECWNQIQFITDPLCSCCGLPFEYKMGEDVLCGECMRERPAYSRGRAAFKYDEHSRQLILRLKYQDQAWLATIYGKWLMAAGKELVAASDVIIPVPLHYWRFVGRRYNQSALLASALAKTSNLPILSDALRRTRRTTPQTGLTRKQRADNVRGAFTINSRYADSLKGKSVLLIDDVMTTGSTINVCTKTLLKAGAQQVNILTLARTVG